MLKHVTSCGLFRKSTSHELIRSVWRSFVFRVGRRRATGTSSRWARPTTWATCRTTPRPSTETRTTLALHHHHTHTHTHTTVLRPFSRDHPGEPVPEENFWTLWCKGRLTEADMPTIRLGAIPPALISAHLHRPPSPLHYHNSRFYYGCLIWTGRPVFWSICPTSHHNPDWDASCPIILVSSLCWVHVLEPGMEMCGILHFCRS